MIKDSEIAKSKKLIQVKTCDKHGDYIATESRSGGLTSCLRCEQERLLAVEQQQLVEEIKANSQKALEKKLKAAAIPKRFLTKDFDSFDAYTPQLQKHLATCRQYAADFEQVKEAGSSLIFFGEKGTGKTHLACSIAKEIVSQNHTCLVATLPSLLSNYRATFKKDDDSEERYFQTFVDADLLVIDEVGATRGTDFELELIFRLINARYEQVKPCIVITNLDFKQLSDALGSRGFDRLKESGGKALGFSGESYRDKL